jgi:predicted nuclease of restriction endonuclease-like (RecB) superfamily
MNFEQLINVFDKTHQELQLKASRSVDICLVIRNWLFGCYIVEYEQRGEDRALYGDKLIDTISIKLKATGIKGVSSTNLKLSRQFYLGYSKISQTLSDQSLLGNPVTIDPLIIQKTLSQELLESFKLSWSHYLVLLQIKNEDERKYYEIEASKASWSVRELERQIHSCLYERLCLSVNKKKIKELSKKGQVISSPQDVVKNPYILEFLDLDEKSEYSETELETAIINKIEHFLLELGKGFLFEARQKRFTFEQDHFYVDLVFYNRLLKSYVLIDLKLDKLTHQDLGQMQMYVNYFDRYVKMEDENPTIGIVLCKRKNDSLVELTLPQNANVFASKYQLYLPSKEELKKQLEDLDDHIVKGDSNA